MKKGSLPPQALWDDAYVVVGGTIHDLHEPNGPYVLGTLRPAVPFRGAKLPAEAPVRLYGPEADGRSAIWMLRTTDAALLTEEYPWMRVGPETFLIWPPEVRDRVLAQLPHARRDGARGAHLYVIRAPSAPSESMLVWVALVEDPTTGQGAGAALPERATLRALSPGGAWKRWTLLVPQAAQRVSQHGSVRVLERRGSPLPQQIAVAPARGSRPGTVRVEATFAVPGQDSLTATLDISP